MSSPIPIFGILTDFGFDFAVASMKAVLLQRHPHAQIIDIDHTVPKFSLHSAAFIIDKIYHYFPQGTIFICVVDPGVGSQREAICVQTDTYLFFGPNNGIFDAIVKKEKNQIYQIDENKIKSQSSTFHGRDLFIPAASAYADGERDFLIPLTSSQFVTLACDESIIVYIDSFGNIKTTIMLDEYVVPSSLTITVQGKTYTLPFVKTFSDTTPGTLLSYKGSNNTVEVAVNLGSAQAMLNAHVGDPIAVSIGKK